MTVAVSSYQGGVPKNLYGYDVIDFLGEGAGSSIYAVSDPKTRQLFALKQVFVNDDKQLRFFEQLQNEFDVGQKLSHPNLRRLIDLKVNRTMFRKVTDGALIMELFDGMSLEGRPQPSVANSISYFLQTAQALVAMHQGGFVHCDLKPNNILVGSNGLVKVIDLGQACPVGTVKKRIQGTPDYIAPEQVKREPVSVRTDVFNFGATLYWVLTRQNIPTLYRIKKSETSFLLDTQIQGPAEINGAVPENLSNLVMECVRTNQARRPADMSEVYSRLELIGMAYERASRPAVADIQENTRPGRLGMRINNEAAEPGVSAH